MSTLPFKDEYNSIDLDYFEGRYMSNLGPNMNANIFLKNMNFEM